VDIIVTSDGFVLASVDDDVSTNHFIGTYSDLRAQLARAYRSRGTHKGRTHRRRHSFRQQDWLFRSRGRLRSQAMENLRVALYARVSSLLAQDPEMQLINCASMHFDGDGQSSRNTLTEPLVRGSHVRHLIG
jgi:hypothetical protein